VVSVFLYIHLIMENTIYEVIMMTEKERQQEQRQKNRFNNQTNSTKVQGQNQTHNSKKEGFGPNTKR
jgi:hypothetical protein